MRICLFCIIIFVCCTTEDHVASKIINTSKKSIQNKMSSITTTTLRSVSAKNPGKLVNKTIGSNITQSRGTILKTANLPNSTLNNTNTKNITFWDRIDYEGNNITRTYSNGCVNFSASWIYRAKSVNTFGECINVFQKLKCVGYLGVIQNDENLQKSLGKFSNKIASFRKCPDDSNRILLGLRPKYNLSGYIEGERSEISVMSGVCTRLLNSTDGEPTISKLRKHLCFTIYRKPGCKDAVPFYLARFGLEDGWIYVKTCDLVFQKGCTSRSFKCPKFIIKGSVEYSFWKYLFSIYPRHYRKAFEARVNASTDGFISWDFLFPANASATSRGDQYQDAIESQIELFQTLRSTQSGTLGFDEKRVITLRVLANQVYLERSKQFRDYNNATTEEDGQVRSHERTAELFFAMQKLWKKLDEVFSDLVNNWTSNRGDSIKRRVEFEAIERLIDSRKLGNIAYAYSYKDKCMNMSYWSNTVCKINTFGHCVTAYSEPDCEGTSVNFHPLGKGNEDMIEVDFCQKTASFKQCDPITELKVDERPVHQLYYRRDWGRNSEATIIKSNQCVNLADDGPPYQLSLLFSICFVTFKDENCQGDANYNYWPGWRKVKNYFYHNMPGSLKLCELNVTQSNSCDWCPKKFLTKDSSEYVFWWYLFSIYSPRNRQKFADQFENSMSDPSGYIEWEFLFSSNASTATNSSLTEQYEDALNSQFDMLRSLYAAVPGTRGFNLEQLETLADLAARVSVERLRNADQRIRAFILNSTKYENIDYRKDGGLCLGSEKDRHSFAFLTLITMWIELRDSLRKIIEYWNSENLVGTSNRLTTTSQSKEVTFWELSQFKGANISHEYNHACVNVNSSWVNGANSLDTRGKCINVYTKTDCKGETAIIQDSMSQLVKKVASFKKCDPKTLIKLDERPRYSITIFDQANFLGQKEDFRLLSGECSTLPAKWHGRVNSIDTRKQCFVLFDEVDCKGTTKYSFPAWMTQNNLKDANFQGKTKSFKTCPIRFDEFCRQCPQIMTKYGLEYTFWDTFFSIYSRSYREEFEERIERAYEGFISWDFIFSLNAIAENFGDQYQDVLENHLRLFRIVQTNRPGLFNLNSENVQTLLTIARNIKKERKEQWLNMLKNGEDASSDFVVLYYLETVWQSIQEILSSISQSWNQEDNNAAICGLVERKKQSEETDRTDLLINNGDPATYGDDPWHVAIYRIIKGNDPILVCGGTLISSTVVVSAAHCFYYKHLKTVLSNVTSEYEIYVGKYSKDYDAYDGPFQKKHEIAELIFNPKKFNPDATKTFGSDIVLIMLNKPVTVSSFVCPICLDWDNRIFSSLLGDKPIGRIVGWGSITQDDNDIDQSEYLRKAELIYITHEECAGKTEHLSRDNFCGVSPKGDTGPSAQRGDSGGGFVFKYKGRYYLRGIVSTRDKYTKTSTNAFTDVSEYISWIRNYV